MITVGRVENDTIVEAYLVDEVPPHMAKWPILPDYIGIGWVLVDGAWTEPKSPAPVPDKVSAFQARAALFEMGLLDAATAITQSAGGEILLAWEYATEFRRDSAAINGLAPHLNLTDNDIDNLFRLAATKTA